MVNHSHWSCGFRRLLYKSRASREAIQNQLLVSEMIRAISELSSLPTCTNIYRAKVMPGWYWYNYIHILSTWDDWNHQNIPGPRGWPKSVDPIIVTAWMYHLTKQLAISNHSSNQPKARAKPWVTPQRCWCVHIWSHQLLNEYRLGASDHGMPPVWSDQLR